MNLRALAKSSALYTVGNLASRLVGFLMIPVYTRFLSTADYGVVELVDLLIVVVAIGFGLQAMGSALIRIYHDRKEPRWQREVVSSAILAMVAGSALLSLLGVLAAPWLAETVLQAPEYTALLRVTFVAMVVSNAVEVCLTYLRITERPLHFVLFSLVHLFVTLGLNIYLIVFRELGVWGFVLSKLFAASAGSAYLLAFTFREVGFRWSTDAVKRMARFGAPLIFAGVAMFGVHFLDRFILNHYASLGDVGLYALAYKFGFLITFLVGGPFHRAWNATLYAHVDEAGWQEQFGKVFCVLLFFLLFAWTGLSSLVDEALTIMADPAFHGAAAFVPVIAMGYVARTLGDFFKTLIFINKRSALATKIVVACALLNVGLNFALIPTLGIWGAAWSTLLTWGGYMVGMWYASQREHRLPIPYRSLATLLAVAALLYVGARAVSLHGPLALRLGLSLGFALLFPAAAWLFFSKSQKEAVRRLLVR